MPCPASSDRPGAVPAAVWYLGFSPCKFRSVGSRVVPSGCESQIEGVPELPAQGKLRRLSRSLCVAPTTRSWLHVLFGQL